jgi:hypothetical protein
MLVDGPVPVLLLTLALVTAGCAQPSATDEAKSGEPCDWIANETACTMLPSNVSGLDWIDEQNALLAGSAAGITDPDPQAHAQLLVADTLGERWSVTVEDSATEPPILASASGEVFLQLDGRRALFLDDRGRVQASQSFEPLAWTGWASPTHDVFAVETIPDSVALDVHVFDRERSNSYTASLGEEWTMQDGADDVWFFDEGTRAIFAVSTYGGEASPSDPDCYWLSVDVVNQTHDVFERDCDTGPAGVLADGLLATTGDRVMALDHDFNVTATREVSDLSTLVRYGDGTRVVANRGGLDTETDLPALVLDSNLDRVGTVPGGTLEGLGASPHEAGCLGFAEGAPNEGRTLRLDCRTQCA